MSFEALRQHLPQLPPGDAPPTWPRIGRGGVSFSDDLLVPGGRLGVRVRITDRDGGGYVIDLRDCDPAGELGRYALGRDRAMTSCILALGHALGHTASKAFADSIELLLDPHSWIGTDDARCDPAALAHGMARTTDTVLGALANAWPGRVGAGSGSLGAIVELRNGDELLVTEVLPGGEGGRPDRAGADAWHGLILDTSWPEPPAVASDRGLTIEGLVREGSGGTGKHDGGCGVIRRYQTAQPIHAFVAFDRTSNPPHGIDRAGPPAGTEVWLHAPDDTASQPVEPWQDVVLPAGSSLEVRTGGGAGWGFPGYGDIEWDPSEWFGSKAKSSG